MSGAYAGFLPNCSGSIKPSALAEFQIAQNTGIIYKRSNEEGKKTRLKTRAKTK